MKKVFVMGHGIMANEDKGMSTMLKHDFYTYCKPGKMFDGGCAAGVIDGNGYAPVHQSSKDDAADGSTKSGNSVMTHWACSEKMAMFVDLKDSAKMKAAKPEIYKGMVQLGGGVGKLFKLDDTTFVYITEESVLTPLDAIQNAIDAKFPAWEYEIHWALCRSYAEGGTPDEVFAYAEENMLGGPQSLWK